MTVEAAPLPLQRSLFFWISEQTQGFLLQFTDEASLASSFEAQLSPAPPLLISQQLRRL